MIPIDQVPPLPPKRKIASKSKEGMVKSYIFKTKSAAKILTETWTNNTGTFKLLRIFLLLTGTLQLGLALALGNTFRKESLLLNYAIKYIFLSDNVLVLYLIWELIVAFVLIISMIQTHAEFLNSWFTMKSMTFIGSTVMFIRYIWIQNVEAEECMVAYQVNLAFFVLAIFALLQLWAANIYQEKIYQKEIEKEKLQAIRASSSAFPHEMVILKLNKGKRHPKTNATCNEKKQEFVSTISVPQKKLQPYVHVIGIQHV